MTTEEIAFIEDEQKKAKGWANLSSIGRIASLCNEHGCNADDRKRHEWLFCHETWNVHPPERFRRWWENQGWQETEDATERGWSFLGRDGNHHALNTVTAYNCAAVRDAYKAHAARQDAELLRMKTGSPTYRQGDLQPERKRHDRTDNTDDPIPF